MLVESHPVPEAGVVEHEFVGQHVLGELYGVSPAALDDAELLVEILEAGIGKAHASVRDIRSVRFTPGGVSVVAILSESHASIHTYPEERSMFVDVFTCGRRCNPRAVLDELVVQLQPMECNITLLERGQSGRDTEGRDTAHA